MGISGQGESRCHLCCSSTMASPRLLNWTFSLMRACVPTRMSMLPSATPAVICRGNKIAFSHHAATQLVGNLSQSHCIVEPQQVLHASTNLLHINIYPVPTRELYAEHWVGV